MTGANELSFDDTPDHEEVFVHASRNLREEVAHDRTTFVGRNQTLKVKGDLSIDVSGRVQIEAGELILLKCGNSTVSLSKAAVEATHQTNWLFIGKEDGDPESHEDFAQLSCDGAYVDLRPDEVNLEARSKLKILAGTSSQTIEPGAVTVASKTIDIKATSAATLSGLPVQLQGPGLFAARVTDPAPAAILMGAALVQVGGPSFPLPVERLPGGVLKVGANLVILPSGEDRDFQAKVLRDLGIMASTPTGLKRLHNIENAPGGHQVTIRDYTVGDANRVSPESGLPYGENNSLCSGPFDGRARRAPDGSLERGDGAGSTVAYNPDIVTGVSGDPAPADATLFHELGHAEHNLYGTNRKLEEAPGDPHDEWDNHEEWQTIEGPINQPGDGYANDVPDVPYSPSENEYLRDRQYPYQRIDHGHDYEPA
ncbi:MAG: M91 family zinc metallopeptidase [Polyangiales bacterium]